MVSPLAVLSDDPSLNPAGVYSFTAVKLFEKNENKRKKAGDGRTSCKKLRKQFFI